MKNLNDNLFWPLLVGLVSGLALIFFTVHFFQPQPRVIFTLSEQIEHPLLRVSKGSALKVQQLVVTNAGNAPAKNISVKFTKPILFPVLKKYVQTDSAQDTTKKPLYEASYVELRPDSAFRISFVTAGGNIGANDFIIKSSEGDAEEATSAAQSSIANKVVTLMFYGLLAFNVFSAIGNIKSILRDMRIQELEDLAYATNYSSIKSAFAAKPWFFASHAWADARVAITQKNMKLITTYDLIKDEALTKSTLWCVLVESRPDTIPSHKWEKLVDSDVHP